MNDDTVKEAQDIIATFAGHGWGSGASGAYRDQGEIDALIHYGPLMLNALRMLVLEVQALRAHEAATDDEPEPVAPEDEPDRKPAPHVKTVSRGKSKGR